MHTRHSHDCSIEPDALVAHAEAEGIGAIAVTDHNVFAGALETVELARDRDLIVIPGEEVKTDRDGEVIGLFLHTEIPRGMSFTDTVAAIREQQGVVYVPHPFDRMHSIPAPATLHRHLPEIDVLEVYNARLLFDAYNDEALRFARKHGLPMGAGSDAHVLQGVGTGALWMRRFEGPEEFLLALRTADDSAPPEVPRLPAVAQVGRTGEGEGRDRRQRGCRAFTPNVMSMSDESASAAPGPKGRPGGSASVAPRSTTDEIQERYLKRALNEIGELWNELLAIGDQLHVPVLGSGHPLGDVFLLKHRPTQSEIHEGVAFYGRAGQALLKSLQRLSIDPLAVYGTNCLKFGTEDEDEARAWLTRELHIVQPKLVVVMGEESVTFLNGLDFPLADRLDPERNGELQPFTPTIEALVTPDIDASLDEQSAKTTFWNAFKALGAWWAELPPY